MTDFNGETISPDSHVWRELRDLATGDVFAWAMFGEPLMVLDRDIDGIFRVVDQNFNQHRALGCTPVYLQFKEANAQARRPTPSRRATDTPALASAMG